LRRVARELKKKKNGLVDSHKGGQGKNLDEKKERGGKPKPPVHAGRSRTPKLKEAPGVVTS